MGGPEIPSKEVLEESNPDTYIDNPDKAFSMYNESKEALHFALHFEKQSEKEGDQDALNMAQEWREKAEEMAEQEGKNWEKRNEKMLIIVDKIFKDILFEAQKVNRGSNTASLNISSEIERIIRQNNISDFSSIDRKKLLSESLKKFENLLGAEKEPYKIIEQERPVGKINRQKYSKSGILNNIDLIEQTEIQKYSNGGQKILDKKILVTIYNDKDLEKSLKEWKENEENKKKIEEETELGSE